MNKRSKGIALAVITAVMWGIMGIFVRDLSKYQFSNIEISFFRCALAGAAYFVFLLITKPAALKINLKGIIICIVYGAVAYSISFVSYSVAVSRIPVGVATVLMFMSPIWVAILGRFMFGEKLEKSKIITIFVCLIGAILRYTACLRISWSGSGSVVWNGFWCSCRTFRGGSGDQSFVGSVWDWNTLYDGGECGMCEIYSVCRGDNDEYSICTGSCCRDIGWIPCVP